MGVMTAQEVLLSIVLAGMGVSLYMMGYYSGRMDAIREARRQLEQIIEMHKATKAD